MALTPNHYNNELVKFRRQVFFDFLRASRFDPFMGANSTYPIVRMEDLAGDGKEIRVPLVTQLVGPGVGAGILHGKEEMIDSYGMPVWADWARNGVVNNRAVNKESSFSLRSTARSLLSGWARRTARDDIVDALLSIPTAAAQAGRLTEPGNRVNGVKWSAASGGQKDSWVAANYDRLVFGALASNRTSTWAASIANVDAAQDKMTAAIGTLMKMTAAQTGVDASNPGVYNGRPKINPWQLEDTDQEWYVTFVGSRTMRDLKNDPIMAQANRDARNRENAQGPGANNPIWTGGGLVYDGIYYLEIPEITQRLLLVAAGGGSADIEPVFLCGQAALAYAFGQAPRPTRLDETDYDFLNGLGVEAQYGVAKVAKAPIMIGSTTSPATTGDLVDWGMVTGFVAAPPNA